MRLSGLVCAVPIVCIALGCGGSANKSGTEYFIDEGQFMRPPQPDATDFCAWDPIRSDSEAVFSEPLAVEDSENYEINITADFQDYPSDFEYPETLRCSFSVNDGKWLTSCPGYTPTDTEFSFDNIPNWEFDDERRVIGFRWYRLVSSADIQLIRNGTIIFDGEVQFVTKQSECEELQFDFPGHPEDGQRYRSATGTVDTSE